MDTININKLVKQIPSFTYNNDEIIDIVIKIKENIITSRDNFPKPINKGTSSEIIINNNNNYLLDQNICIKKGKKYYKYIDGECKIAKIYNKKILWISQFKEVFLNGNVYDIETTTELDLNGEYNAYPECNKPKKFIIPRQICELVNLQNLDLSHRHFKSFPEEIFTLVNLQKLDLSHTNLTYLPSEI